MRVFEMPAPTGLDSWRMADRPEPTLKRGQVLVKIRAASLNYRDVQLVSAASGPSAPRAHLIPVSDGAGEVVEIGEGVNRVRVGERVTPIFFQTWIAGAQTSEARAGSLGGALDGVLAEYAVFDQNGLVPIADHLSFEEAACLPCAGVTAWNALFGLRPLQLGQSVLTLGTGGVSMFATQFARMAGARVISTSSSDAKLGKAVEVGAVDAINYRTAPDWDVEVRRLTSNRGVDQVVEIGGTGTLPRSIKSAASGGIVNMIGALASASSIDPMMILGASCIVRGVLVGSREMFEAMNRAITLHKIRPVIDRVFEFEDAPAALAYLAKALTSEKWSSRCSRCSVPEF